MLQKKVILITGTSSGFGLHAAVRLSAAGHKVYATMRDIARQTDLITETNRRGGQANLVVLPLDVTKPTTIKEAVRSILSVDKTIDVLINNAGFGIGGFFEDITDEEFRHQFDVNLFGVLNVIREVLPAMRSQRCGKIINISSMAAFAGTPAFSAYVSSKWALEGFTESLSMELSPFGIHAVLIEPGSYKTRIFSENARYGKDFDNPDSPYYAASQHLRTLVAHHINRNTRNPEEVAMIIQKVIEDKNPEFRNIIGFRSKLRVYLSKLMPFKLYSFMVQKALFSGLNKG